jgi:hypothetical protein
VKIVFTKHALEKFTVLERFGWNISKRKISETIKNPRWKGTSRFGQGTAMSLVDEKHIIRVVIDRENGDIIRVITFHIARRGTYESTLR